MELKKNSSSIIRTVNSYLANTDASLWGAFLALSAISILTLFGVGGLRSAFFDRHIITIVVSMFAAVVVSSFNYRYLKNYSAPVLAAYFIGIILLLITLLSPSIRGTRAWIVLGGFSLEPSELVKLALIVVMAKYFSQRHTHISLFRHIVASGVYLGFPLAIILAQPDLGSSVVLVAIWLGMLLAAGINKRHLALLLGVGIVVAALAWQFGLAPYQRDRILAFIDPYEDPTGIGYNIIQSKIAIGSGGWLGKGLGQGTQASLGFLPEAYNDFAFAALAEQFGLVGVATTLALIIMLLMRIMNIARRNENNFAKLCCLGITLFVGTHVFINASVNLGILPITGLPFSFLSYGGSHWLALGIGIGIVQGIKRYGSPR